MNAVDVEVPAVSTPQYVENSVDKLQCSKGGLSVHGLSARRAFHLLPARTAPGSSALARQVQRHTLTAGVPRSTSQRAIVMLNMLTHQAAMTGGRPATSE